MSATSSRMLDAIRDRILILNPSGKIVYTNSAARGDFSGELSAVLASSELRAAVRNIGALPVDQTLNLRVAIDPADPDAAVECSLTRAPNGTDAVVIVHPGAQQSPALALAPSPMGAVEARTVAELLRQHVLDLIERFVAATDGSSRRDGKSEDPAVLAIALSGRMKKLIDMVALFGDEAMIGDERILIAPLATEAGTAAAPVARKRNVRIALSGFDTELSPVYGSRKWLLRALSELIEAAVVHARPNSASTARQITVEIAARQTGAFLLLDFRNLGVGAHGDDHAHRVLIPDSAMPASDANDQEVRIGLPIVQRVMELHGGLLRVREGEEGNKEFTIQLPTGAPFQTPQRVDMEQARKYAEDLARLMAGRRKGPTETTGVLDKNRSTT